MLAPGYVYLLHFHGKFSHAQHYIGYSSNVPNRMVAHEKGRGASIVKAVLAAGIEITLAATWAGDRKLERKFKNRKNAKQLCPICQLEGTKNEQA